MHEMHVIKHLFEDLLRLTREQNVQKVTNVYLKMGKFTGINEDMLRYFFAQEGENTPLEGAVLHIENSSARELRLVSFDCD